MSAANQVAQSERASNRQRRSTRAIIKRARREGRISADLCETRMESALQLETTAELRKLTSDLGEPEGTDPRRATAAGCCVVVIVAAWEPVFLSGPAWFALAVPVTLLTPFLMWALLEFLA